MGATNGIVKIMDTNAKKRSSKCHKIKLTKKMKKMNYQPIVPYVSSAISCMMLRVPDLKTSEIRSLG